MKVVIFDSEMMESSRTKVSAEKLFRMSQEAIKEKKKGGSLFCTHCEAGKALKVSRLDLG